MKVYPEVPVRVEYELSDSAKVLSPIWLAMEKWGDSHREKFGSGQEIVNDSI